MSGDVWDGIAEFAGLRDEASVPSPVSWDDHVACAQSMRDFLDAECNKTVCGVCSIMRRSVDVQPVDFGAIPNLELLRADGPKTLQYPREGLTATEHNGTTYCIQPAACTSRHDGGQDIALCKSCLNHLKHKRVPPESLVCFDAGKLQAFYSPTSAGCMC